MTQLMTVESQGEGTLIAFYNRMADELDPVRKNMINFLARSLMGKGWLPSVANVLEELSEDYPAQLLPEVLRDLARRRLIALDGDGKRFTSYLGSISLVATPHRAEVGTGNFMYTYGGLELLAISPIFGKDVELHTVCGHTEAPIKLSIKDEQIVSASPAGIAGFAATWDGKAPLDEVAKNSPLFASDAALEGWTTANPQIDGLPMSADLLLFVGIGMLRESGNARHRCVAF